MDLTIKFVLEAKGKLANGVLIMRCDGRANDELRRVEIDIGVNPYAEGSARISYGNTVVLVTASIDLELPRWMKQGGGGWITAEYGMLPRATHTRNSREAASGKQSGRTQEIQRLIGRSLRQSVDLSELDQIAIKIDCDVLIADGGTRTASITGAWVALYQAIRRAKDKGQIKDSLVIKPVCAVSVGQVMGELVLDLAYEEDSAADFDLNIVYDGDFSIIEIQGTAEKQALDRNALNTLLDIGERGAKQLFSAQRKALEL